MPQSRPATTPKRKKNPVATTRRTSFRNGKSQNASTIDVLYFQSVLAVQANDSQRSPTNVLRSDSRVCSRNLPLRSVQTTHTPASLRRLVDRLRAVGRVLS